MTPLLAALGVVAFVTAAVDRFQLHFGYHWPLLILAGWRLAWPAGFCGNGGQRSNNPSKSQSSNNRSIRSVPNWPRPGRCRARSRVRRRWPLRDSEALYHSLVDHLPLSVLRKDEAGTYTFVNRRYLEFSGKGAGEILGTTDFDIFPHELATRYRQGDERVLATGAVRRHRNLSSPTVRSAYIQVLKTPIRDAQTQIIGTQVMFWDVTDRRRAEEALEHSTREVEIRNAALRNRNKACKSRPEFSRRFSTASPTAWSSPINRESSWFGIPRQAASLDWDRWKPPEGWTEAYGLFKADRKTPIPRTTCPSEGRFEAKPLRTSIVRAQRSRPQGRF